MKSIVLIISMCALGFSLLVNLISYGAALRERELRTGNMSLCKEVITRQRREIIKLHERSAICLESPLLAPRYRERI